ncbi:MAG: hypothetical protein ACNA7Y_05800, partial [Gammaproteobacteria bacterium]
DTIINDIEMKKIPENTMLIDFEDVEELRNKELNELINTTNKIEKDKTKYESVELNSFFLSEDTKEKPNEDPIVPSFDSFKVAKKLQEKLEKKALPFFSEAENEETKKEFSQYSLAEKKSIMLASDNNQFIIAENVIPKLFGGMQLKDIMELLNSLLADKKNHRAERICAKVRVNIINELEELFIKNNLKSSPEVYSLLDNIKKISKKTITSLEESKDEHIKSIMYKYAVFCINKNSPESQLKI